GAFSPRNTSSGCCRSSCSSAVAEEPRRRSCLSSPASSPRSGSGGSTRATRGISTPARQPSYSRGTCCCSRLRSSWPPRRSPCPPARTGRESRLHAHERSPAVEQRASVLELANRSQLHEDLQRRVGGQLHFAFDARRPKRLGEPEARQRRLPARADRCEPV